ncbi:MAG: hypothetical protein K2R98_30640 [Gemmataceae bacterium]|nr:hypothetical protein [Gemmataceae bacterium]
MTAVRTTLEGQRTKAATLRVVALVLCPLAFTLFASGCRRGSCDLVESELRHREQELAETRDALHRIEANNEALQRQLQDCAGSHSARAGGEYVVPISAEVKEIMLGRGTGGVGEGKCPGDDSIQVVVEPKDCDGHSIKAPGMLRVAVLEVTSGGVKKPLSGWDLTQEQLRRTWKSGLLSTGYYVVLPWKTCPSTEKIRVVAQLILADGRVFEADKDVTIKLPPEATRKPLPTTVAPEPEPTLPSPKRMDGPELQPARHEANKPKPLTDAVKLGRPRALD